MLNGDGDKNSNKKKLNHTLLYISLPLFCMTTMWNFQKLLIYMYYGGIVVCVPVHLYFHSC